MIQSEPIQFSISKQLRPDFHGPVIIKKASHTPISPPTEEDARAGEGDGSTFYWEQTRRDDGTLVTEGKLFYNIPDGGIGVMNLTTSP